MPTPFIGAIVVFQLLIALQLVHAQFPPQCPPVGIENGAFESGQLAPWYDPARGPENADLTIVSPGDKGPYALQIEFPAATFTSWTLVNPMGPQCAGGQYRTSFAINWVNFTALEGDPVTNFCRVDVGSSYCYYLPGDPVPYPGTYNATSTPGWQTYDFTCTAHKTAANGGDFVLDIGCETTYIMPAFTWQVTDFSIKLVGYSAPPSSSSTLSTPTPSQSYPSQSTLSQSSPMTTPLQSYPSPSYLSQSTPAQSPPLQSTTGSVNSLSSIPSSPSSSPTSLPSNTVPGSTADKTYQALGTGFFLGPVALVVLLIYLG
jgi:hypothetical protein